MVNNGKVNFVYYETFKHMTVSSFPFHEHFSMDGCNFRRKSVTFKQVEYVMKKIYSVCSQITFDKMI